MNGRAPEPTAEDLQLASKAHAAYVFRESQAGLTVAWYRRLCTLGPLGVVAMNLFRASKTSARAKVYRGRHNRGAAYDVKQYSLASLCKALYDNGASKNREYGLRWGWKEDRHTIGYPWILYVDLPNGQVSFHSPTRDLGPDYTGEWDRSVQGTSADRVIEFCDAILSQVDRQI